MTICIATIADDGKSLVLAADKEITYSFPLNIEVEDGSKKIVKITDKIFILAAGIGEFCVEITSEVKREKQGATSVKEITEYTYNVYTRLREQRLTELYLRPRGFISAQDYIQKQQQLNLQVVNFLDNVLASDPQGMFSVALIIAGIDTTGTYIYTITPPGTITPMNQQGFATIGIGDIHANNSLIGSSYKTSNTLKESLYLTYEAKKRSEVAPGVGKSTDIITVTNEQYNELTDKEIIDLDKIVKDVKNSLATTIKTKLSEDNLFAKKKK